MDWMLVLWLSGLILSISYLGLAYDVSFAFNRPIQSSVITLAITGVLLILVSLVFPSVFATATPPLPKHDGIPLAEHGRPHGAARKASGAASAEGDGRAYSMRRLRFTFTFLVAAICLRVEAARRIITHVQCAGFNSAPFIPLFVVLYMAWVSKKPKSTRTLAPETGSTADAGSRWGYVIPFALSTWATVQVLGAVGPLRSTYICPLAVSWRVAVPFWQTVSTLLDALIIIWAFELTYRGPPGSGRASTKSAIVIGWAFIAAAVLLFFIGLGIYFGVPYYKNWVGGRPRVYMLDSFRIVVAFALAVSCSIQVLARTSPPVLLSILLTIVTNAAAMSVAILDRHYFAPLSAVLVLSGTAVSAVGLVWTVRRSQRRNLTSTSSEESTGPKGLKRLLLFLAVVLAAQAWVWLSRGTAAIELHPIEVLMAQAQERHNVYQTKAAQSKSLAEAAKTYRSRYGRDPPPRFDKWYNFTTQAQSAVIDEFDSIYNDLLPFWALPPGEIRWRTWETVANPANWVGGLIIRKGKLTVAPGVPDTHRWMLDSIISMIEPFAEWLPDMDLAFNLNEESRVAVPFKEIERMRKIGREARQLPRREDGDFDPSREEDWKGISPDAIRETRFRDDNLKASFFTYGSAACAPWDKARLERHWTLQAHCESCAAPHSMGQFVSNWTLSGDPCHQPDLADLHGFYLAPATFVNTHELMPVFSQSKAAGFNDILYPSAFTYEDKATYEPSTQHPDPSFQQKESRLFWRGGTSEGFGTGYGPWKGMSRQRLVHMFNNATSHEKALVLLPGSSSDSPSYVYRYEPPSTLHRHLSTDIRLVNRIERCRNQDCDDQTAEFAPQYVEPVDFQTHWQYKYLFDLDGAGFSGRFLPFLSSNSLPFKTALFREWWESRLEAWVHFVPVDLRLTETWSILAYFDGWRVNPDDRTSDSFLLPPHQEEAERIARAGKEWAAKVLRKEDMQVYLFRLLLEWGRLTDDNRDALGYHGDS